MDFSRIRGRAVPRSAPLPQRSPVRRSKRVTRLKEVNTGWWVAGVLAALMVGGFVPAAGWFTTSLRQPSARDFARLQIQLDRVEERQQTVLQRLAAIDAEQSNQNIVIEELRQLLQEHVNK